MSNATRIHYWMDIKDAKDIKEKRNIQDKNIFHMLHNMILIAIILP